MILEAEAKGTGPVHLTAEEWEAASARAASGGGCGCRKTDRRRNSGGTNVSQRVFGRSAGEGDVSRRRGSTVREGAASEIGGAGDSPGTGRGAGVGIVGEGAGVGTCGSRVGLFKREALSENSHGVRARRGVGNGDVSDGGGGGGEPEKRGLPMLAPVPTLSGDVDIAEKGGCIAQAQERAGLLVNVEHPERVGVNVWAERGEPGVAAGSRSRGSFSGEHDSTADGCRRNTEAMSSRPSSFGTAGEDDERGQSKNATLTVSRSWSWVSFDIGHGIMTRLAGGDGAAYVGHE